MNTLVEVKFESAALARYVPYVAIIPDRGTPPFPVLYQLHGYSDDCAAWIERSNLVRHLRPWPLVCILPSGENSYYVGDHETMIVRDLPAHAGRILPIDVKRAVIGGLSMGGYGAIRLGLKYPSRYLSIYAHSSRLPARDELPLQPWAEGHVVDDVDVDAMALGAATRPALAFDCGTEDHLLADSRRFHAHLDKHRIAHEYAEYPGAHDWDYWDTRVVRALAHHARVLGLSPFA
jgi:S-formylglutathione hydrolase FrmB